MDQATLFDRVRRDIGQVAPVTVGTTQLTQELENTCRVFATAIEKSDPYMMSTRKGLVSDHHIFAKPAEMRRLLKMWDYREKLPLITNVTKLGGGNPPINVESIGHGYYTGDVIYIHDVGGAIEANGNWKITVVDDDNFTLDGSGPTPITAYTSGGISFKEKRHLYRIYGIGNATLQNMSHRYGYFMRGSQIVIDYLSFDNDIIIEYLKTAYELADIPPEFHTGIAAQMVVNLIDFSVAKMDKGILAQLNNSLRRNQEELTKSLADIQALKSDSAPMRQGEDVCWDSLYVD